MAHSFHISYDSGVTWVDMSTLGLRVNRIDWPFLAPVAGRTVELPYADGGAFVSQHYGVGRLGFTCVVNADDAETLNTYRDGLKYYLDPRRGDISIKADYRNDRFYVGRLMDGVDWEAMNSIGGQIVLPFKLSKAFAYSTTETTQTITVASAGQAFDVPAASGSAVAGTAEASPVYVVKNTSGMASGILTLTNSTTGEAISATGIANGTWIKFDRESNAVYTSTDSGTTWTAAMSKVWTSVNIPKLTPQEQNEFTLTGLASGSIVVTYRARYL